MKKRIISVLLALCMLVGLAPALTPQAQALDLLSIFDAAAISAARCAIAARRLLACALVIQSITCAGAGVVLAAMLAAVTRSMRSAGIGAAGVRTLQTHCPKVAVAISLLLMLVPLAGLKLVARWQCWTGMPWLMLSMIVGLLSGLFLLALEAKRYHRATSVNCQLCVALLHIQSFPQSWPVCLASLVAIQLLFLWYNDEKE